MAIHPQFRSSATPGAAPDVADMLKHEVAINTADAKLFAKDVNDVLKEYSITGETITRFVISQADATANPAQVGERIRIVATSETISLPFPQDPVEGQTITIITHQDSDAGFFAELSSTGIPFRVEDTESTAPHVLRFSADDNGTETAVDGEYVLTFTGAFWTLDNPMSLSLVPNALHWRSGNADFYAGELAAGRSVTVLADDGHFYKLSTDRTVYLGEVPDGVVRNNLTPEHIDSVVWTVSVNRNDRWNGTAWAPHPGAQGSPDPIPGIPSIDPSALANTARGKYADWIRLDSRVEYVRGATYENLLVKSDDSVSSKIIDDLSKGRRKVGDIISIESFFRASDYADGLPHGFNKAVIVDGQHGSLSDTLFAVGDYRLKLLFDDDIYRATQLGAKDDLADYSSFLRNLTENVAAGKTLVFDDFTYHITALKIFSNTTVKTSNGGSFRCIDGTGVDSGSNYYLLYNLGESGVVYDSIVVDGNKANNSAFNLFDAITCVGDKSKVINCKVTNAADSGIFIGDGANMYAGNNEIEGATDAGIYANRNTVHTGEYSVTIENNQIHDCTEAGIAVKRVAQKVNVNTNTVTGTCGVGISLTKAGDVSAFGILGKSSINGNTVDTAGGLCVAVHNSKHVSVANNVLSLTGTTSDPAIIDIGGSKAVSVSGNTIAGDKQTNGATQIKGILIRDRERNAGDTDPANNDISEGVTISSNAISDCDVAHNILITTGGNASENIKYRGNVIIDCNAEFSVSPGIDSVLADDTSAVQAMGGVKSHVDIREFAGADAGNGVVDCSQALSDAIDSLPVTPTSGIDNHGATAIMFPPTYNGSIAVYRFASPVIFNPARTFSLLGSDGAPNYGAQILNDTGTDYVWVGGNSSTGVRIAIQGFCFKNGGVSFPDRLRGLVNVFFNVFSGCPGAGVLLQNDDGGFGPTRVDIMQNKFYQCRKSIDVDASTYLIFNIAHNEHYDSMGVSIEINGPGGTIENEDFQGVVHGVDEPFIWFRGTASHSADTATNQWRVKNCRFGGESFTKTIDAVEYTFDVPRSTVVFGESGLTKSCGGVVFSGNHIRGKAGGAEPGYGDHFIECHSKPNGLVVQNDNIINYGAFGKAIVKQHWITDPAAPTEVEAFTEMHWGKPMPVVTLSRAITDYVFDNGDGVLRDTGIGWETPYEPEKIGRLRNGAYINAVNHGVTGGETQVSLTIKVGLETTRPAAKLPIIGSTSSARIMLEIDTDGTLSARLRTTTSTYADLTSTIVLPDLDAYTPMWIKMHWESGVLYELSYSLENEQHVENVEAWTVVGTGVPSADTMNALLSTANIVIGNTVPYALASSQNINIYAMDCHTDVGHAMHIRPVWLDAATTTSKTGELIVVYTPEPTSIYKILPAT